MTQSLNQLIADRIDFSISESSEDEEEHKVDFSWKISKAADELLQIQMLFDDPITVSPGI